MLSKTPLALSVCDQVRGLQRTLGDILKQGSPHLQQLLWLHQQAATPPLPDALTTPDGMPIPFHIGPHCNTCAVQVGCLA